MFIKQNIQSVVFAFVMFFAFCQTELGWAQSVNPSQNIPEAEENTKADQNKSTRHLYLEANRLFDSGFYGDAIRKYSIIIEKENSSLRARYAHLRLAEANEKIQKWDEAELNYRQVLLLQAGSDESDFIHYRLIRSQYEQSLRGLFKRTATLSRDIASHQRIIQAAGIFFLLYQNSEYLAEVRGYYQQSRLVLAGHERLVANFYFEKRQYIAAANRYLFLLKNYPEYSQNSQVLNQLINSYHLAEQTYQAREWEQVRDKLGEPKNLAIEG